MRLRKIEFRQHPILGNLSVDLIDPASGRAYDTVVFAGENGTGKTALLEGVFRTLSGDTIGAPTLEIELSELDLQRFRRYYGAKNLQPKDNIVTLRTFREDGSTGLLPLCEMTLPDGSPLTRSFDRGSNVWDLPTRCLFSEAHLGYRDIVVQNFSAADIDDANAHRKVGEDLGREIPQLLVDLVAADNETTASWVEAHPGLPVPDEAKRPRIRRFDAALQFMFPSKTVGPLFRNHKAVEPTIKERGSVYPISALSSGEKQILFRGGFLLRHSSTASGSILLVDEPELGLHPDWQAKVVEFYQTMVGATEDEQSQFIFATHSPFIVHQTLDAKVIILKKDLASGDIQVEAEPVYPTTGQARVVQALNVNFLVAATSKDVVVLVEGETDQQILETAWKKLFAGQQCPYEFRPVHSKSQIRSILNHSSTYKKNKKKLVGLFDFDSAYDDWAGTWKKDGIFEETDDAKGLRKRHKAENAWVILLPVPPSRSSLAGSELEGDSRMSIELMFDRAEAEHNLVWQKKVVGGGTIPAISRANKVAFSELVANYSPSDFENFRPLFDALQTILRRP